MIKGSNCYCWLCVLCALMKQFLIESTATNLQSLCSIKYCLLFFKLCLGFRPVMQWVVLPLLLESCDLLSVFLSGTEVFPDVLGNAIFADYFPGHNKLCCVLFNWCTCNWDVFGTLLLWKLTSKSFLSDPIYSWYLLLIGNQPNLAPLCSCICNYDCHFKVNLLFI